MKTVSFEGSKKPNRKRNIYSIIFVSSSYEESDDKVKFNSGLKINRHINNMLIKKLEVHNHMENNL